jgi:hypothetical protein
LEKEIKFECIEKPAESKINTIIRVSLTDENSTKKIKQKKINELKVVYGISSVLLNIVKYQRKNISYIVENEEKLKK